VDFNLLMSRLSFYRKEEADAITKSQKGCGDDCKCQ
jgi:hypothetical protein